MKFIQLRNKIQIPQIGMGTWQITEREMLKKLLKGAYDTGYRLVDTAAAYTNEIVIGKAIVETGIPRNELFLSDKVWNTSRGYEAVQEACKKSLKKLKTDYLDLYMIHWPASMALYSNWQEINAETWRGMERLYIDGYVRAIGVCNFKEHHLEALQINADIMPMVNQYEFHPGMLQPSLLEYCLKAGICVEASSPLGNGEILTNDVLRGIALVHNKAVSQVCLRWVMQHGAVAIPKTSNVSRLSENMDVFDFELTDEEMKIIDEIAYCGGVGIDPDEVTEFG